MKAIALACLQIFLLLLRAHFSRNDENQEYREHLGKAQAELDKLAANFEQKMRFSNVPESQVESLQKKMDEEMKKHGESDHTESG